ncbi:MAG: hypothetical protein JSV44_03165 [Candidatus Zixiibacteriota bacterium]|nr:MAG: hypothetical protein JSV44_03165 [candidate division Zixibacteria bacterium]
MDTIIIIFLLAIIALILVFIYYDRYKKDKKGKDPALYIEGLRALLDGREEAAFHKFREVVAEDSGNIDAYLRIGDILRKYGKADKALQVHKDLTLRHGLTAAEKRAVLRGLTEDFLHLGETALASAALKELLSLNPGDRWAHERLLQLYTEDADWDRAYAIKEKLIKLDGNRSKKGLAIYKFHQGENLFRDKDYHKARMLCKEAISMDPGCVPAYIMIGDSYLLENRVEDAVAVWHKMVRAVPDEAHRVLSRLKKALFDLGRFGDISTVCEDILEASPKNLDARLTLADYHLKKGEHSIAAEHLQTAIDDHPDSYIPILELAKLYLAAGEQKKLSELIDALRERREVLEQNIQRSPKKSRVPT